MARVVVSEFVSIDGVMEAPGGEPGYSHSGWVTWFQDSAQVEYKLREVLDHEALLLGRITYEGFADAWPSVEGPFGDKMNTMPKYVASTTIDRPRWNNTTVLQGDVPRAVADLKQQLAGDILVVGSRTLVNALKRHHLVDEYRLVVFPVVLGSGMRLFDDELDAHTLELIGTHTFPNGAIVLSYQSGATPAGAN